MLQLNYSVVKAGVYSVKCYSENCFKSVSVKYSSMPAQSHLCNYELQMLSLGAETVEVVAKLRANLKKTEGQS